MKQSPTRMTHFHDARGKIDIKSTGPYTAKTFFPIFDVFYPSDDSLFVVVFQKVEFLQSGK